MERKIFVASSVLLGYLSIKRDAKWSSAVVNDRGEINGLLHSMEEHVPIEDP